ncbi:uncharacterized protein E0L32_009732 [Thyridium curvatum]|uniref:Uncharacterized protein n=1 Tax=Thyridium curvatum TaxID=1093900 RepID=A0A507AI19_9PEZI|nr:uncharacterized protein E0L32_009732 [Thyridium curvatum]TPX08792.1 hypothetical protein E0L32_009732 [Thyridium curvatum]
MEPSSSRAGSMPQPYPPQPPSPTLTNPDMILPEYERSSSPGYDDDRSHSPLMMWKNAHAAASGVDLHALTFTAGPITPTTPIIYGNGTMLSDIGEVTEVESTVGKPSPQRRAGLDRQALADKENMADYLAQPARVLDSVKRRAKEQQASVERLRRSSGDSTSTITTQDRPDLFADFDDSMSVGDSVFQGDDEESVAESYVPDSPAREPHAPSSSLTVDAPSLSGGSSVNGGSGNEDQRSAADLSKRAEQILANAKRRLTTMEGNLTRARSSLQMSSPTGFSDGSTPSPPFPLRLRDHSTTVFAPGHARIGSDNALRLDAAPKVYTQRSASAMGAAGGYRPPLISSQSLGQIREDLNGLAEQEEPDYRRSTDSAGDKGLESVSEDAAEPDLLRPEAENASRLDTFLSPTFGSFNEKGLTRSASVAQMRDLKDQMKDLKGKISSLREQARADSMKRRSLQSLRTPSPFTHARIEQWYGTEPQSALTKSVSTPNDVSGRNPWNGEVSTVDGESDGEGQSTPKKTRSSFDENTEDDSLAGGYESQENGVTKLSHPYHHQQQFIETPVVDLGTDSPRREPETIPEEAEKEEEEDVDSDMRTENGDDPPSDENQDGFATAGTDWESEAGESEYHDTFQHPISHEDREDAFDYEHFILHSALGTINQQRLAGRGSFSSEDSVETTRGPTYGKSRSRSRTRRGSAGSVSTVDSFATATEGRASRYSTNRSSFETAAAAADETAVIDDYVVEEDEEDQDGRTQQEQKRERRPATPPPTARRGGNAFSSAPATANTTPNKRHSAEEQRSSSSSHPPAAALARRPASSAAHTLHRPSVSSFDSTGTQRSFPLVGGSSSSARKKTSSNGSGSPVAARSSTPPQQQQHAFASSSSSSAEAGGEAAMGTADRQLRNISESLMQGQGAEVASAEQQQPQHQHKYSISSARSTSSLGIAAPAAPGTPAAVGALSREDQMLVERAVAGLGRCVLGLTESGRASAESRMYRRRIDAARRILEGLEPLAGAPGGGGDHVPSSASAPSLT